jgi:hypothetical protein
LATEKGRQFVVILALRKEIPRDEGKAKDIFGMQSGKLAKSRAKLAIDAAKNEANLVNMCDVAEVEFAAN